MLKPQYKSIRASVDLTDCISIAISILKLFVFIQLQVTKPFGCYVSGIGLICMTIRQARQFCETSAGVINNLLHPTYALVRVCGNLVVT